MRILANHEPVLADILGQVGLTIEAGLVNIPRALVIIWTIKAATNQLFLEDVVRFLVQLLPRLVDELARVCFEYADG